MRYFVDIPCDRSSAGGFFFPRHPVYDVLVMDLVSTAKRRPMVTKKLRRVLQQIRKEPTN